MKTQEEIEEKYEELNRMMRNIMPTEESNKKFATLKGYAALEKNGRNINYGNLNRCSEIHSRMGIE